MQDSYPNLPGILTEFKDGGLQLRSDPNPPPTESVLVLGTATDGPVGVPVAVDPATVEYVFGKVTSPSGVPNGATLVVGFEEAWAGGCRDIRLMRISGEVAKTSLTGQQIIRMDEVFQVDDLGLAAGNTLYTITLANTPIVNTTSVAVGGVPLAPANFTVNLVTKVVTINAGSCSAGLPVVVEYQWLDDEVVTVASESGAAGVPWITPGADQNFTLNELPVSGTLVVLADGVFVAAEAYVAVGSALTLKTGFVGKGAVIQARYVTLAQTTIAAPVINIETVSAGLLYNQSAIWVEPILASGGAIIGKKISLEKPDLKKRVANEVLTYSSLDYPTWALLVRAINTDPYNGGVFKASVSGEYEDEPTINLLVTARQSFVDGVDGLHLFRRQLYELLGGQRDAQGLLVKSGVYQLLENYTVDWIVPQGVYKNDLLPDPKTNFGQQLCMACAVISHRQHTTYGAIATRPPAETGLAAIQSYSESLLDDGNDFFILDRLGEPIMDSDNKAMDIGRYLHCIGGPDLILRNSRLGVYTTNSAAYFAGQMTTRRPGSSPMNKVLPGVLGLRHSYGNPQRNALTGARYVTYKTKFNGTAVAVEDSMTCAQPGSDYARTPAVRSVKAAVDAVRDACDPYLGEPSSVNNRNAMSAAIDKRLSQMIEDGDLSDAKFQVISTLADQLLGKAKIELTIVPPMEFRQITIVVDLSPAL